MTNADVIRKMNDKQLFEFLSEWELGDIDYSITFCDMCEQDKKEGGKGNELGLDCDGCKEHWLKRDAVDFGGLLYWKKNTLYGDWIEEAEDYVSDLPTIEVSEEELKGFNKVAKRLKSYEAWVDLDDSELIAECVHRYGGKAVVDACREALDNIGRSRT